MIETFSSVNDISRLISIRREKSVKRRCRPNPEKNITGAKAELAKSQQTCQAMEDASIGKYTPKLLQRLRRADADTSAGL